MTVVREVELIGGPLDGAFRTAEFASDANRDLVIDLLPASFANGDPISGCSSLETTRLVYKRIEGKAYYCG